MGLFLRPIRLRWWATAERARANGASSPGFDSPPAVGGCRNATEPASGWTRAVSRAWHLARL